MFQIITIAFACGCGACLGYVFAVHQRRKQTTEVSTEVVVNRSSTSAPKRDKPSVEVLRFQAMLQALQDVTSQVDNQVSNHSERLTEATMMLETPEQSAGAIVLGAASMLLSANQHLQSELASAKVQIEQQRQQIESVMVESRTDALTKLANRRAFDLELERQYGLFRRNQSFVSLLMVDIDHFKKFNDTYGHMVGDLVLQGVARGLTATLRDTDFVARFGGEEFSVLLPVARLGDAIRVAERIHKTINESRYRVGDTELQVTISLGVAEIRTDESIEEFLHRADEALYAAKENGRNCCCYHDGSQCGHAADYRVDNSTIIIETAATANHDQTSAAGASQG